MNGSHRSRTSPVVCETANAVAGGTGTHVSDVTWGMAVSLPQSAPLLGPCNTGAMASLGDFQARSADGSDVDLSSYDGQVVLVVNTATKCGFAGQFGGLQRLHDDFGDRGFAVLGFPSDQFKQEPVEDEDLGDRLRSATSASASRCSRRSR